MATTMIRVKDGNKWTFFNSSKRQIIPGEFSSINDFEDGCSIVCEYNGHHYGLIDENGKVIVPFLFYYISKISNNIYQAREDGYDNVSYFNSAGQFVDKQGNVFDSFLQEYDIVECLANSIYRVCKDGLYGILYFTDLIITSNDPFGAEYSNGLIRVYHKDSRGVVVYDIEGKERLAGSHINFIDDLCLTVWDSILEKKVYDYDCNQLLPYSYKDVKPLSDNRIQLVVDLKNENQTSSSLLFNGFERHENVSCSQYYSVCYDIRCRKFVTTNEKGQEIFVDANFKWCGTFLRGHCIVRNDSSYGVIDSNNNLCIPCDYDYIEIIDENHAYLRKESKWFLADYKNNISPVGYASIKKLTDNYFLVGQSYHSYGLINCRGEEIIHCCYNPDIEVLSGSRIIVSKGIDNHRHTCMYNDKGNLVITTMRGEVDLPKDIVWIDKFSDGVAVVKDVNNLSGIVDEQGEFILPCCLAGSVSPFFNGFAIRNFSIGEFYSCKHYVTRINKAGKNVAKYCDENIVINENVLLAENFNVNSCIVFDGTHWGLVGTNGYFVKNCCFDRINHLIDGYYCVLMDGKYGIIYENGEEISPCIYKEINVQDSHFVAITDKYQDKLLVYVYLNKEGRIIAYDKDNLILLPPVFEHVGEFVEGYATVRKHGKWGIINKMGNVVVECLYSSITSIKNNHAHCIKDSQHYLVSVEDNSSVIIPECSKATYYNDDCIVIGRSSPNSDYNRYSIINIEGEYIIKEKFQYISEFINGYAIIRVIAFISSEKKFGIINQFGEIIVEPNYTSLEFNSLENTFVANKTFDPHIIDLQGRTVLIYSDTAIPLSEKFAKGNDFCGGRAMVFICTGEKNVQVRSMLRNRYHGPASWKTVDTYKIGFINKDAEEVIPCKYDTATDFIDGISIVSINEKYGVIDIDGNTVVPFDYDSITRIEHNLFKVKRSEMCGFIDSSNNEIIPLVYKELNSPREGLIAALFPANSLNNSSQKDLWGYVDINNTILIDPQFNYASDFSEGLAAVIQGKTKSVINIEGKVVFGYLGILSPFKDGVSTMHFDHYGKIVSHSLLSNGSIIVGDVKLDNLNTTEITKVFDFHEGLAKVQMSDETYGFINTSGDIVISKLHDEPSDFNNGFATFDGPYEYPMQTINKDGKRIVKDDNDKVIVFPSKYYAIKTIVNGLYQAIDESGDIEHIINGKFDVIITEVGESVTVIDDYIQITRSVNAPYCYYDKNGNRIIPDGRVIISKEYDETHDSFKCGLAAVSKSGLWGFVDNGGNEVIECQFSNVEDFCHDYCVVTDSNDELGVIDKNGRLIIPFNQYRKIVINEDSFFVTHDVFDHKVERTFCDDDGDSYTRSVWEPDVLYFGHNGCIKISLYGEEVFVPSEYDWAESSFDEGFLSVHKDGLWGCLSTDLTEVIPCIYDEPIKFEKGVAFTEKYSQKCVINTFGREIIHGPYCDIMQYDDLGLFLCTVKENEEYHIYNRYGDFILNSKDIKSRIQIPDSNNLSSNFFTPKQIIPLENDFIKFYISAVYQNRRFGYWGLCDLHGNIVLSAKYDDIKGGASGLFAVAKYIKEDYDTPKKWGFIDSSDRLVVEFKYYEVSSFVRGLAVAKNSNKIYSRYGIIGTNGKELTDFVYNKILPCDEGMEVSGDNMKNIITRDGSIHISCYDSNGNWNDTFIRGYDWCIVGKKGYCIVLKGKEQGIIDAFGSITMALTELKTVDIKLNSDGELVFYKYKTELRITEKGEIITTKNKETINLPFGIHWCKEWKDNFIEVEISGKWGLLDSSLNFVVEAKYDEIQYISNNMAFGKIRLANKDYEYYLFDLLKKKQTKINYSYCSEFLGGCAIVKKITTVEDVNWKGHTKEIEGYGIIDNFGFEILPCVYRTVEFKEPEPVETYRSYDYDNDSYSWEESMMDALDGEPDAYWNID